MKPESDEYTVNLSEEQEIAKSKSQQLARSIQYKTEYFGTPVMIYIDGNEVAISYGDQEAVSYTHLTLPTICSV